MPVDVKQLLEIGAKSVDEIRVEVGCEDASFFRRLLTDRPDPESVSTCAVKLPEPED